MKDLEDYFTENVKANEASNSETKEVTKESEIVENDTKIIPSVTMKRKRGRVKIKISQINDVTPVCDIVESKNDLIDKTPSPFAGRDVRKDESSKNDTPKRSHSLPRQTSMVEIATGRASLQSENEGRNSGDENDNSIPKVDRKNGDSLMEGIVNGRAILVENAAALCAKSSIGQREESNAFQVLMTRKKPVQFIAPVSLNPEERELTARIAEESKLKLKRNKEKLVALADKKGYTKRKLGEIEEAERMEKRLEKRAKVFKTNGKKEAQDRSPPLLERRSIVPGNLHNYFTKATSKQKGNELTAVSTLVVKAEVHSPDSTAASKIREKTEGKIAVQVMAETAETIAIINDIQTLGSENVKLMDINLDNQANENRKKKPRWSLRVNLQCNNDGEADGAVQEDDQISSATRELKPRKSKTKLSNNDASESIEHDSSNVNNSKKQKTSGTTQKSKNLPSNVEIETFDLENKFWPGVVDVTKGTKTAHLKDDKCHIIEVGVVKRPSSEKLAPLFVKKQKPDPAVLEARRLFLHSVQSGYGNQRTDRKVPAAGVPMLPFPTISHVTQLSEVSNIDSSSLNYKYDIRDTITYVPSYNLNDFQSVNNLRNEMARNVQDSVKMSKDNVEDVLNEIETRCSEARELWEIISFAKNGADKRKSPKRKSKKRKSIEKKVESVGSEENIEYNEIWTHKYRPMNSRQIVGNEEAAKKLHTWLDSWKVPLRHDDTSSGDEFYSSDCSYASDNNQVAVLLGPHGSGKTASVYAIAEELGYSVIEVNASSKRAGKKLLKELEEATKSHRIKKTERMPLLLNAKEKEGIPQNSLILVEDVDLIFEEDEGFITATCQLASNTKRPIVMTGRDTCSHLNRMAPQQLRIYYQTAVGSRVSALLELITLAESGYRLPQPCLDRLLQNGDLRKAILQLQYLLLSGQPSPSEVPTDFRRSLWQDMRCCLYKPAIKATKKASRKKLTSRGKFMSCTNDKAVLTSLANDLESLSILSTLIEINDPALDVTSLKFEPSMSLEENSHAYSSLNNTSEEIAHWLSDRVMNTEGSSLFVENDSPFMRQLSLKKELNTGVNLALSQVSPCTLDGRIMALDYLPSLRVICRAEDTRITTNTKRGNRFFHYLQNLRLPSTSIKPNILAAACKMMIDKNPES